jgi:hypothetical protein
MCLLIPHFTAAIEVHLMNQFIPLELLTVHRERKYLSSDVPSTSAGSDILQFGWLVWWWRGQVSVAFAGRRHEVSLA